MTVEDDASIIDVLKAEDEEVRKKAGCFPVERYRGLLQMVYHPYEKRFYKQVAVQAHVKYEPLNVWENLTKPLPDGVTVILIPEDGCQTDWEEPVQRRMPDG